jgi:hypothetical protein
MYGTRQYGSNQYGGEVPEFKNTTLTVPAAYINLLAPIPTLTPFSVYLALPAAYINIYAPRPLLPQLLNITDTRCQLLYSKIPTNELSNQWNRLAIQYSDVDLGTLSGSIIAKYRIQDQPYSNPSTPVVATWTNSNEFTIASTDIPVGVQNGDEVFILSGLGAGATAHILSMTGTPTTTVTLDEDILTSAGGTFNPIFSNFTKLPTGTYEQGANKTYKIDLPETLVCEWVEIKLEIRGSLEVESIQVAYEQGLILEK